MTAWSEPRAEGFAIAAIAHEDAGAVRAAAGLCEAARPSATKLAVLLSTLPKSERRGFLRERLRGAPLQSTSPAWSSTTPRVRALLAHALDDRALARAWMAEAAPRHGFVADRALVALLTRMARALGSHAS